MPGRSITMNRADFEILARRHVTLGSQWGNAMGTDYWLTMNSGFDEAAAASTATTDELAEAGWTATSLVNTAGSAADFGSSSDKGTPNHFLTNASADLLSSPAIFGDYAHMQAAAKMLGRQALPKYLIAEFYGAMTVASADEPRSGWGFIEDGGSAATQADQLAYISCNGTNWTLNANAATPVVLSTTALDTGWHKFTIILNRATGLVTAKIDDTLQTQSATLAITNDEFPCKFGFHALTTNRPALGLTHISYDWD